MKDNSQVKLWLKWLTYFLPYPIVIWFYWPTLIQLGGRVANDEHYSFGILIPFVIAYIIYLKWPQIWNSVFQPNWLGLLVLIVGFILNIFWELGAVTYLAYLSFLIVIIGLLMLQGGGRLIRLLAFPLLLLFISLPLPDTLIKSFTFRLQLFSSWLAARTLEALGYVVYLKGNVLDLGSRQLQVAEACSGLGYLFSALVLGIIFCYFFQRRAWKGLALLLSLFPISVAANVLRILSVAIFPVLQAGFWHMAFGLAVFILVFYYLTLGNRLLNKLSPPDAASTEILPPPREQKSPPGSPLRNYLGNLSGLAVVIVAIIMTSSLKQAEPATLAQSFDHFPLKLGPWEGKRSYLGQDILQKLGTNDYLQVDYVSPEQGMVSLWIAYYPNQSRENGLKAHSPQGCLKGAGVKIVQERQAQLAPGLPVGVMVVEQSGARQLFYYWYLQRGSWVTSDYSLKLRMGLGGLLKGRNDGAYLRLITPVVPDMDKAEARLRSFAQFLLPVLPQFIPSVEDLGPSGRNAKAAGEIDLDNEHKGEIKTGVKQ